MMSKIKLVLFTFLFVFIKDTNAQKKVTNQNLGWLGLNTTIDINQKWYFQNEMQVRQFLNPFIQHQYFIRSHLRYKFGQSGYDASVGLCYFSQKPNDPEALVRLSIPEWRPHLELIKRSKINKIIIESRYRAEARFFHQANREKTELVDGYRFNNYRLRYRLQATIPILDLSKTNKLKFKMGNEVMLNLGSKINLNVFDQNRFSFSFGFNLYRDISLDIGYLNWFQELTDGSFINRDIVQVTVFHKLRLKKNKSETSNL
jgi:hypothetical protein